MNRPLKNSVAVLSGLAVIAGLGLLLYPLMELVVDKFLHIFEKSSTRDDIIFTTALLLYAMLPSFLGGWITARMADSKPVILGAVTGLIGLLILFIVSKAWQSRFEWEAVLYGLILPVFTLLGAVCFVYYARRKDIKNAVE